MGITKTGEYVSASFIQPLGETVLAFYSDLRHVSPIGCLTSPLSDLHLEMDCDLGHLNAFVYPAETLTALQNVLFLQRVRFRLMLAGRRIRPALTAHNQRIQLDYKNMKVPT
jgi:hypothetical protein